MRINKKAAAAAVAAVALTGTGVAYAYWSTTGSGSTTATAEAGDHAVTFTGVTAPTGMYPGGTASGIAFTIHNPGPSKQYVGTVTAVISSIDNAVPAKSWSGVLGADNSAATCTPADYTLAPPTVVPGDLVVGDTAYTATQTGLSLALQDLATNQDGCKNAVVHLALSANRS